MKGSVCMILDLRSKAKIVEVFTTSSEGSNQPGTFLIVLTLPISK
jgi:hypothetical protein